jgi:hypothetical protein
MFTCLFLWTSWTSLYTTHWYWLYWYSFPFILFRLVWTCWGRLLSINSNFFMWLCWCFQGTWVLHFITAQNSVP